MESVAINASVSCVLYLTPLYHYQVHARIQEIFVGGGGGGGPGQSDKKSSDNVFLVLSLVYEG